MRKPEQLRLTPAKENEVEGNKIVKFVWRPGSKHQILWSNIVYMYENKPRREFHGLIRKQEWVGNKNSRLARLAYCWKGIKRRKWTRKIMLECEWCISWWILIEKRTEPNFCVQICSPVCMRCEIHERNWQLDKRLIQDGSLDGLHVWNCGSESPNSGVHGGDSVRCWVHMSSEEAFINPLQRKRRRNLLSEVWGCILVRGALTSPLQTVSISLVCSIRHTDHRFSDR